MADVNATAASFTCASCGHNELADGGDGFFFCSQCGAEPEDIIDTGIADEDFVADKGHGRDAMGALYSARHTRHRPPSSTPIKAEPLSQLPFSQSLFQTLSQNCEAPVELRDHIGPTEPSDFGPELGNGHSTEDYLKNIRLSYVYGLQLMINHQCVALVKKFNASPLICGISGSIWLRYLRSTRVFDDGWADEVQLESQLESQGCNKEYTQKTGGKYEPRNSFNRRMVLVWYRALRKKIPLSCTLAITYLSCHVAREAVLPTDMQKWCLEGKLPYLADFVDIEKTIKASRECPLSASYMFRPSHVPLQKLESLSAQIAQSVGLTLPPVNFYAIASHYLRQLSLPVEKILPYACSIQEWSMPPGLWLSTSELRFPTRVCVMAILVIAIRIMYDLNGFGKWEASLSDATSSSSIMDKLGGSPDLPSKSQAEAGTHSGNKPDQEENDLTSVHKFEHGAPYLLRELQKRCSDMSRNQGYAMDMPSFLQYCKDVSFGGLKPSFEDYVEEKMIEKCWDFHLKHLKDSKAEEVDVRTKERRQGEKDDSNNLTRKFRRCNEDNICSLDDIHIESPLSSDETENSASYSPAQSPQEPSARTKETVSDDIDKDTAIRLMKLHMEENRFCYIPPRERVKRLDYLHYVRKRDDGSLTYAAHADYYILLHACAKEAQVDVRIMHQAVMSLERRLAWIEKRIDHCLREFST